MRLARRMPSYKVLEEDGLELHVVETTSVANLAGLYEVVRGWQGWAFLVDGTPATRQALADLVAQRRQKLRLPRPPATKLSAEEKMDRKTAADMAGRARSEELKKMGCTRDQLERFWLDKLREQRRRRPGPDPELGF